MSVEKEKVLVQWSDGRTKRMTSLVKKSTVKDKIAIEKLWLLGESQSECSMQRSLMSGSLLCSVLSTLEFALQNPWTSHQQ